MFDSWIVGRSPDSLRSYVLHTQPPRFLIEIIELEHETWKAGAVFWIDDPGPTEAAHWSAEAGKRYFQSLCGTLDAALPEGVRMANENQRLRTALLRAESALRVAIGIADPQLVGDQEPMKDLQEALGMVAQLRVGLESGRWDGRSDLPDSYRERQ